MTILWRADVLRLIQDLNDNDAAGITIWNSYLTGNSLYRQACKNARFPNTKKRSGVRLKFLPDELSWSPKVKQKWKCSDNWHPGNVLTSRLSHMLLNHICQ